LEPRSENPLAALLQRRRFLWVVGAALLSLGSAWAVRGFLASTQPRSPLRVLIVRPATDPNCGLVESETQALSDLLEDFLEGFGNCAVSKGDALPDPGFWLGPAPEGLVIRLHPRRVGQTLALDLELATPERIQHHQPLIWRAMEPAAPGQAFHQLAKGLPMEMLDPNSASLLPRSPEAFWKMLSALEFTMHADPTPKAFAAGKEAQALAPRCAGPDYLLGRLHVARASNPDGDAQDLYLAQEHFSAALRITSNYPKGLYDLARLRSDTGSPRAMLHLLLTARAARPGSRGILGALSYCARYAGLLDLAAQATSRANELNLNPKAPPRLQKALLYSKKWDLYEQSLYLRPGLYSNNLVHYSMGHLALLRGQKTQAIAHFEEGELEGRGSGKITRLCRSFRLILQGRAVDARLVLDELRKEQSSALVPDGEFSLGVAEAYALLGNLELGMEMTEQSFSQGFACGSWYEEDPLLAPLRDQPRWNALRQRLLSHQAEMRAGFPAGSWNF